MVLNRIIVLLIRGYQKLLSAFLPPCCRFNPSCSEYALQAFSKYGFFTALLMTIKRVVKCHPYHPGGYDPLP